MSTRFVLSALGALAFTAFPLAAQRFWLDPAPAGAVAITVAGAHFDEANLSSTSGSLVLRGRTPVGEALILTGELPFAHGSMNEDVAGSSSSSALGNPWIGIEPASPGTIRWEVGVRPGIFSPDEESSNLAWVVGALVNFDSWEAWFPEVTSLRAGIAVGAIPDRGVFLSGRLGGTGFFPRDGDRELFADYGARGGVASPGWLGWLGILGHGVVTESEGDLGERTVHQAELGIERRTGGVRPRITIRRYIGEEISDVYVSLGISALL